MLSGSPFSSTRVHFVNVLPKPADLRLLSLLLEDGLEVPLMSTILVREIAGGLARLHLAGGRVAVRVAGGFPIATPSGEIRSSTRRALDSRLEDVLNAVDRLGLALPAAWIREPAILLGGQRPFHRVGCSAPRTAADSPPLLARAA